MTSAVIHPPVPTIEFKAPSRVWHHRALYLFLLPFAVLTILFGLWPIVDSIRVAFTDSYTALSPNPKYVGFDNFRAIFAEPAFHASLWRTLLFTVVSVVLNVAMALGLALLLAHPALSRGRTLFKLAIFLPVITPDVASFIVWKWMFNQKLRRGEPGSAEPWPAALSRRHAARRRIHDAAPRRGLAPCGPLHPHLPHKPPAARQVAGGISSDDGANRWQRLIYVTIPQLRPAHHINTIYALIEFLKTFTVIFIITRGGPNFSTNFVSYYAYSKFNSAQYGEATAIATVLFAAVFALAVGTYWYMERGDQR
jgi:ABC-type sugar transport system permease subunit